MTKHMTKRRVCAVLAACSLLAVTVQVSAASAAPLSAGHLMCHPEPPDYPGCTYEQTLPSLKAQFRDMMTGDETGYRYWDMGQRPSGHLLDTISPALDKHLAEIWWDAYTTAKAKAAKQGVRFHPAFNSWRAFANAASAGCPSAMIGVALPFVWCSGHAQGFEDADWRAALWDTTKAEFACGAGAAISWRMATQPTEELLMAAGKLGGGYWEAIGVQTACVTLWAVNKLFHFVSKAQP